ncbi:hypothetical protein [Halapricum salinum]|nr:hypothetical protein [Halapricum salinum]
MADEIDQGFRESQPVLIEALPSIGKSYGVVKWAAETNNKLTVFTARHDLFDQYTEWCEEFDVKSRVLPSFHIDCETANGEHGEKWANRVKTAYRQKGLFPGELHNQAKELFDEPLPCQRGGGCSYLTARDFEQEEYHVLIGHYRHAHVPNRVKDRYVAFDEFPEGEFLTEYSASRITTAVSSFLDTHSDLPFHYLKDLKEYRRDPERRHEGLAWFDHHNPTLKREIGNVIGNRSDSPHPEAAAMTYAILIANDLDNRWEYARLPDGSTAVTNPENGSLTVLNQPNIENTESVIALDGTPTVIKWELMLGDDLLHKPILTEREKRSYLRDTLGISILQTTAAANHYSGRSGISVTPELDLVLFEAIGRRENTRPSLISSARAIEAYRNYDQGGFSNIIDETEHYSNLKGSNKFSTTRVGIVAGCPHYGDGYIQKWAALAGESVEIALDERGNRTKGMNQDFGSFGNQILWGMRENEVLQAVLRFGRDSGGAIVYVHTAALPQWVERSKIVDRSQIQPWSDGMVDILQTIRKLDGDEWRTNDIADQIDLSGTQTNTNLNTLHDLGYLCKRTVGRGEMWSDKNLAEISTYGYVRFNDAAPVTG